MSRQLSSTAELLAGTTNDWLQAREIDVSGWAADGTYAKSLANSFVAKSSRRLAEKKFGELVDTYDHLTGLYLLGADGKPVVATEEVPGPVAAGLPAQVEAEGGIPAIGSADGKRHWLLRPVLDDEGAVIAFLLPSSILTSCALNASQSQLAQMVPRSCSQVLRQAILQADKPSPRGPTRRRLKAERPSSLISRFPVRRGSCGRSYPWLRYTRQCATSA